VAILGAGAMGTLFAYQFAEHNDVTLVDIRGDVVDTINENGGVQIDDLPVRAVAATREPARAFATNYLFVFVKAQNTLPAIRPFAGKLNPATPIVSLQNGLGNEEAIIAALGSPVPLVIGVTDVAALAVGHGRSRRQGAGNTVVGSAGASTATVRAVAQLIGQAHLDCAIAYDIRPHLWGKLVANAAINAISALAESKNGIVTSDPDASELARCVAIEGAAVARGLRISMPIGDPWEYVRCVATATAGDRNSMTVDLAAHLTTEIDHVNGALVTTGRRLGIPTPYNEALWRMVKAKQNAARE
jgi:2-dehydropantoate 2-reductase